VLDLGTGGGERLASLRRDLPRLVVATEEWAVNAPIAFRRLAPLGVRVVRAKSARLPFRTASFDLVIDRHEEFDPAEVDRVLLAGGSFVTQQVGQHDWRELRAFFPRMTDFGDLRSECVEAFRRLGFEVESVEHDHRVAYPSLGAFVFMLLVSPWTIPEFDVEQDLDALLAFESEHGTREGIVVAECRFLVRARKPS
jgi:SAM-dependent methyltransferase